MGTDCRKLLVVGFDGLDYELFAEHNALDLHLLPLHSPVPVTGPAWTSIYTGDSVATHKVRSCDGLAAHRRYARSEILHQLLWRMRQLVGKLGLLEPLQESRTYTDTSSQYVWDSLGRSDISVKLVNLPVATPVREVNGVHVSGWPLDTRKRWYWPASLKESIPADYAECTDIIHWYEDPVLERTTMYRAGLSQTGAEAAKQKVRSTCQRLADLFAQLPAAQLEMVQFSFIDRLGHVFGMEGEMLTFCYDLVGLLIRQLSEACAADALFVVSDHGFQGHEHTDVGCLAMRGWGDSGIAVPEGYVPDVLDVAPTIAGFFGVEHPCEGNDLSDHDCLMQSRKIDQASERAEIMQRMREIGYF